MVNGMKVEKGGGNSAARPGLQRRLDTYNVPIHILETQKGLAIPSIVISRTSGWHGPWELWEPVWKSRPIPSPGKVPNYQDNACRDVRPGYESVSSFEYRPLF